MALTFFIVALVLAPIVMWIYFFIVPGTGKLKLRHSFIVLVYPLLYLGLNFWMGANIKLLDGSAAYAYGFMNPYGYQSLNKFIAALLGLMAVVLIFAMIMIGFKNRILKLTGKGSR